MFWIVCGCYAGIIWLVIGFLVISDWGTWSLENARRFIVHNYVICSALFVEKMSTVLCCTANYNSNQVKDGVRDARICIIISQATVPMFINETGRLILCFQNMLSTSYTGKSKILCSRSYSVMYTRSTKHRKYVVAKTAGHHIVLFHYIIWL